MKFNDERLQINSMALLAIALTSAINNVFPPSCGLSTAPKNPENIWQIKVIANIYDLDPKAITRQALETMHADLFKEPTQPASQEKEKA